MRKLTSFIQVSLDGFFADERGDFQSAHHRDAEFGDFVKENSRGGGALMLGRKTYELMASWWPTEMAMKMDPVVAERMNGMPKVVFSRTLERVDWVNTTVVKGDLVEAVGRMKGEDGPDVCILGSGSLVGQLAGAGLIDELQVVVNPVVLGKGRGLFEGVGRQVGLKLVRTRVFGNGCVLVCYTPA